MIKTWRKLDTFIVQDFQWTATARHADIVLRALRATSAMTSKALATTR
jgi:anaerobic selenocysteine-containing dehydrogenase